MAALSRAPAPHQPVGALDGLTWLLIVLVRVYWVGVTRLHTRGGFFEANSHCRTCPPGLDSYRAVLDHGCVHYLVNRVDSLVVTVGAPMSYLIAKARMYDTRPQSGCLGGIRRPARRDHPGQLPADVPVELCQSAEHSIGRGPCRGRAH